MSRLLHGDCLDVLRTLPDCSVDSVVTDPPAGIAFMGKAWDGDRGGRDQWVAWLAERLAECLRVLKPGGHAVVWALPRTSGWTHRALEDAGFEVRDCLTHLFGSGFPKSLDVGKAIDRAAGAERDVLGRRNRAWRTQNRFTDCSGDSMFTGLADSVFTEVTAPATADAERWDGWGTALKPAAEFWYLARKPLTGTVAGNVVEWGTGALNIDGCRVDSPVLESDRRTSQCPPGGGDTGAGVYGKGWTPATGERHNSAGRWPANVALTHSSACGDDGCGDGCPVAELDRQSGVLHTQDPATRRSGRVSGGQVFDLPGMSGCYTDPKDSGASRFFPTFRYQAKPSTREKNHGLDDRNTHPTVKPVELMRWLIRLVTPPGGTVLDPFAGSGTTLVAATLEGFGSVGIEHEADYLPIIEGRIRWAEDQQPTLWLEAD